MTPETIALIVLVAMAVLVWYLRSRRDDDRSLRALSVPCQVTGSSKLFADYYEDDYTGDQVRAWLRWAARVEAEVWTEVRAAYGLSEAQCAAPAYVHLRRDLDTVVDGETVDVADHVIYSGGELYIWIRYSRDQVPHATAWRRALVLCARLTRYPGSGGAGEWTEYPGDREASAAAGLAIPVFEGGGPGR